MNLANILIFISITYFLTTIWFVQNLYSSMYSIEFRFNLILAAGENDRVENRTPADDWPKPSWMMIIKFCHTPALYPFYIMSIVSPTVWYTFCPTVISILFVHWDNWLWNRAVYLAFIIFWDTIILTWLELSPIKEDSGIKYQFHKSTFIDQRYL